MSWGLLGIWSSKIFLKHLKEDDKYCYLHVTVASGEGKETVLAILRGYGWPWKNEDAVVHQFKSHKASRLPWSSALCVLPCFLYGTGAHVPEWGWFFQKMVTGYDWELVSIPRTSSLYRSITVDAMENSCVCLGQKEEGLQQPLGQLHPGILSC